MLTKSLPFLPGNVFSDPFKSNFKKDQLFNYRTRTCLEKPRYLEPIDQFTISSLRNWNSSVTSTQLPGASQRSFNNSLFQSQPRILPQWLKFDKRVLCFQCFFVEHVNESAHENYKIRPCTWHYYLEDDTLSLIEHHVENSGMPQGELIKRHRAINQATPNQFIGWNDINLRTHIFLYGKKIRICNCDKFTEEFYKSNNVQLNIPEEVPEINFGDKFKHVDYDKVKKDIAEWKEYTEVGLKGGHPNRGLKCFLENDRKILCFDISWFDDKYDKEEKRYKMNYYLSDGQIEVCEVKVSNSGKDPFPRLLRKLKLPKRPHMSYCPGWEVPEDEYYLPKDLVLGNYITIYNRKCHIVDCDDYTRQWYKENFGINMEAIKVKRNPPQNIIHPIPPYNGYGIEEDTLLNVKFLNPFGKIREQVADKYKKDKHILRFNAKLISSIPSDEERTFVISFFWRDNAVQVYETAERNSGRENCKFFEKQRIKNPYTNQYYAEKDFKCGNIIYVNKFTFKLLGSDEYTRKYMLDNAEVFRDSDVSGVIERLKKPKQQFTNIEEYLVQMIKAIDCNHSGFVSKEEIENGFKTFGIYLTQQEVMTLLQNLVRNSDNKYSMEELYNLIVCYK